MQPEVPTELAQRKRLCFSDFSVLQAVAKTEEGNYDCNRNPQKHARVTVVVVVGLGITWEVIDKLILNPRWKNKQEYSGKFWESVQ